MKTGERVRLLLGVDSRFLDQSGGGEGVVVQSGPEWSDVHWDNGKRNHYPNKYLVVTAAAPCLPEPEFTLAEINQGSELYTKLEGDRVKRA